MGAGAKTALIGDVHRPDMVRPLDRQKAPFSPPPSAAGIMNQISANLGIPKRFKSLGARSNRSWTNFAVAGQRPQRAFCARSPDEANHIFAPTSGQSLRYGAVLFSLSRRNFYRNDHEILVGLVSFESSYNFICYRIDERIELF